MLADEAMPPDSLDRAQLEAELQTIDGNMPMLRDQIGRVAGTDREHLLAELRQLERQYAVTERQAACPARNRRLNRSRMGGWTLDDIPWDRFDPAKVDPELVPIVKAASLVEHNGRAYAHHLCLVFADDPEFQQTARRWGEEEMQHGGALARWAALADPAFDFDAAFARFQEGFRVDFDSDRSRRGSRAGEMVARCVVEIGTSSYYTAMRDAASEPVLREICRHIAADELRHYRLFYKNLDRYLALDADRAVRPAARCARPRRRSGGRRARLRLLRRERDCAAL